MPDPASHLSTLQAAVDHCAPRLTSAPTTAVILGSGLGGIADRIEDPIVIRYANIPGFHVPTASGHRGALVFGKFESTHVAMMTGRLHRYEGYTNDQVAFPVRLLSRLGAAHLIACNASGGLHPQLLAGDVVVIRDHLNWLGGLAPPRDSMAVPALRRDAADLYDESLARTAIEAAIRNDFNAFPGVYLATLGPCYETRAEYRMMRRLGADVVGMSTVPEVLAAAEMGMRVLGLSLVSNVASPDRPLPTDHAHVLQAGRDAEVKMEQVIRGVVRSQSQP